MPADTAPAVRSRPVDRVVERCCAATGAGTEPDPVG